jgi:NAD(P)-dependent dehydrogenase (short-subunit alcohol dehydrogenase family)
LISLQGKIAVVTGAAAGIGFETAALFADLGAAVAIADIDLPGAQAAAKTLRSRGCTAIAAEVDIADERQVAEMARIVRGELGLVDVLVNNAAATGMSALDKDVLQTDLAVWDLAFAVNVRGTFLVCRHILPMMLDRGGVIINIASRKALAPQPHLHISYTVSKAAVCMLSRHIAASFGKRGVTCNVVAPGSIRTAKYQSHKSEKARAATLDRVLTRDIGEPVDVARAIAFLSSDAGRYITGQIWSIDGGVLSYLDG